MSLFRSIFWGSVHLLSYSFVSSLLGFIVLLVVISVIGTEEYGKYAGSLAVFLFIEKLLKMEIKIFLLKHDPVSKKMVYQTVFTTLVIFSSAVLIFFILSFIFLGIAIPAFQEFIDPFILLLVLLPLSVTTEVPRAILEHRASFSLIGKQELGAAIANHLLVFIFIFVQPGYEVLIIGYYTYNITIAGLSWYASGLVPVFRINRRDFKRMAGYGKHLIVQNVMLESKNLVNPVIVGYFYGPSGVGIISFAEKVVQSLKFYKNVLHRTSAVVLSRLRESKEKITDFLKQFMLLQMIPLGGILLTGSVVVYGVSVFANGDEWYWLNYLYPFLGTGFLFRLLFSVPEIAIQMNLNISDLTKFQIVHNLTYIMLSMLLIHYYGLLGYGLAYLATVPIYFFLIVSIGKDSGDILSDEFIISLICICIALHWYYIGYLVLVSLIVLWLMPDIWRMYGVFIKRVKE